MTTRGDLIADTAYKYVGCSLSNRRNELALFVTTCKTDSPKSLVIIHTNCGMFIRGLMFRCGVVHELLEKPYRIGMAITDVITIAKRFGAYIAFEGQPLKRGTIMHYAHLGKNDDHVEVLMEPASDEVGWEKSHCGAGRDDNAVTLQWSDVRTSGQKRRPLLYVIDPDLLLEPI